MTKLCTCGAVLPYRRAYRCKPCWTALNPLNIVMLLADRLSLGLRGKGKTATKRDQKGGAR